MKSQIDEKKVLVVDNYDSFTYNLVQYIGEMGVVPYVHRNDKIGLDYVSILNPHYIVISPGPGRPEDAGISCDIIRNFYKRYPILGICLGHQCIGYVFGAKIERAGRIMHGKTSLIYHNKEEIFKGIKNPFEATRYHSLIISHRRLPPCLEIIASTSQKEIMAIRYKGYPIWGMQFHPESILTTEGKKIIRNFLSYDHPPI